MGIEASSVTLELYDRQNHTIDELLHVINPENGEAFLTVYEHMVMTQPRHILYNNGDSVERERFEHIVEKSEGKDKKDTGSLTAVVDITPGMGKLPWVDLFRHTIAKFDAAEEFSGNIATALIKKAAGRNIDLILPNIHNLSEEQQIRMLGMFDRIHFLTQVHPDESKRTLFQVTASSANVPLRPKLRHFFLTVPQADDSEVFDAGRARELMDIHYQAFGELKDTTSVVIGELPHKTGKTLFRKTLSALSKPGSIIDVNAAHHLSQNRNLKLDEIRTNEGSGIGFVDHFHLVRNKKSAQKDIINKIGKTIFIVTKE